MPCAFASASVWHPTQPALVKTALPAVGSPFLYCAGTATGWAFGTVPTTFVGSGDTVFSPGFEVEQPAAMTRTTRSGTRRRTSAESIRRGAR